MVNEMNVKLYSLLPKLVSAIGLPDGASFRCALWVRDGDAHVKQITNYWPDSWPPGSGRLHISQGLVGRAFRDRAAQIFLLKEGITAEEHRAELIKELQLTAEQAARVDVSQISRLALPVMRDGEVCAVLYCHSPKPRAFETRECDQAWLNNATRVLSIIEPLVEDLG